MTTEPEFRTDLYRGTAHYYDRYRPPYPPALFSDLRQRLPISGWGRLMDLACGTGQLAFALAPHFVEVVAVDQEEEAVLFGKAKAADAAVTNIRWVTGSAETVAVDGLFELIAIGNAFHRLRRQVVAERVGSWLQPAGGIALVWGNTPNQGGHPWQRAMEEILIEWMATTGTRDRVPADWESTIRKDPHEQVLRRAGLEYLGRFEFSAEQTWTVETLTGFVYSTSILNRKALGDRAEAFERDLAERLGRASPDGTFKVDASYAYELARKARPD